MEERSLCLQQSCCYRSSRPRSIVNLWSMFLSATCILLLARSTSSQAEYTFTQEPPRYYYAIVGESVLIPCAVEVTRDDNTVEPVSPTLFLNSQPLDPHDVSADTRIFAALTHNVVVGLLILDTQPSDSDIVLECAVMEGNETVISMTTNIYIDNGRPLKPVPSPIQSSETVHSITVDWGEAPTPRAAPITHYTIILEELETEREIRFDAHTNNTVAEVTGLLPGTMYNITVVGVNQFGEGQRSNYVLGQTVSSLVPLPPTSLSVDVQYRGGVSDIVLTWTPAPVEPDVMTEVTNFVIYYGRDQENLMNVTTTNGQVTRYNLSGLREKGEWIVGVASINSAGVSTAVYTNITLEPPTGPSTNTPSPDAPMQSSATTPTPTSTTVQSPAGGTMPVPTTPTNLTTIVAIAGSLFVFIIIILIVLIIICVVRHRIKSLGHEQSFNIGQTPGSPSIDELDGSPSMKKKKTPSPKHLSDSSYTSTELRSYGHEPRRAGSRTPPPV